MDNNADLASDASSFLPLPSKIEPHSDVSARLVEDGLSRPRVSTLLRRWALEHEDVRRVVLYHTGTRYCVSVLLMHATFDRIRETNRELVGLVRELIPDSVMPEVYTVGEDHSDAPMFRRFGSVAIIDKSSKVAARQAE